MFFLFFYALLWSIASEKTDQIQNNFLSFAIPVVWGFISIFVL